MVLVYSTQRETMDALCYEQLGICSVRESSGENYVTS